MVAVLAVIALTAWNIALQTGKAREIDAAYANGRADEALEEKALVVDQYHDLEVTNTLLTERIREWEQFGAMVDRRESDRIKRNDDWYRAYNRAMDSDELCDAMLAWLMGAGEAIGEEDATDDQIQVVYQTLHAIAEQAAVATADATATEEVEEEEEGG